MNHPFYQKTPKEQRLMQLKWSGIILLFNALIFSMAFFHEIFLGIGIYSVFVSMTILAPFIDTPAMVKSGKLTYFSPMFIAEKPNKGVVTVHGGTLFDYYFLLDREMNGAQRTHFILKNYLEGLLKLIEAYEQQPEKAFKVRGTSYILNERTAGKIGMKKVQTDGIQTMILFLNYVNLTCSHSLAKARLALPNLRNIHTFEGDIKELAKRKAFLTEWYNRLEQSYVAKCTSSH